MVAGPVLASDRAATEMLLRGMEQVQLKQFGALDLDALAAEDDLRDLVPGNPKRFAVSRQVFYTPANAGDWSRQSDGSWIWRLRVRGDEAAHLNFGFSRFALPPGAALNVIAIDGSSKIGPFTVENMLPHGQLWTPVVLGEEALIHLEVPADALGQVQLELSQINQGYRGFGVRSKACKSGSCNMDVACLSEDDPWNDNRRAVGAWTRGGTDTCSGSLVNNTNNDRRMLFATATHCGANTDAAVATVVVYWRYESPTCRVPGSPASGAPAQPFPATSSPGLRFVAGTNNPFAGGGDANTRSDWALIELATPPTDNNFDLFWAGWDRRPPPTTCAAPADEASTSGLCASIHHPGVDEKRITFIEVPMTLDNISSASGVHWRSRWDPTPPRLPNITPMPTVLPPGVTEPGSSGSALYNADRRLVGVLSGGPAACGATGNSLSDLYGGLFHAWEGIGTPTTRMREHLDPVGTNPEFIDGIGNCEAPPAPENLTAVASAANQISLSWDAVAEADRYRVFRSIGTCPGTGYVQIAEVTGTSYVDTTVSGGSSYVYRVASFNDEEACSSVQSSCASASATGTCALPPSFPGLASAASAGTATCGIQLGWTTASGNCGAESVLRYNVYRSTDSEFVPGPGNLFAACAETTGLLDVLVDSGETQHYIVRAEDLGGSPAAGQCGGVEETNLVRRSAAAFGPDAVAFEDDVEGGPAGWTVDGSGGGANFAIVSTASSSPTNSWFVAGPSAVSDRRLALAQPLSLQAGTNAVLEFAHRRTMENGFDGSVLEYSIDGGATWVDILAGTGSIPADASRFLQNGYVGSISTAWGSPIGGRQAWTGTTGTDFILSRVSLADFGGQSLRFRFRYASDSSVGSTGWWIDDIRVSEGTSCQAFNPDFIFAHGFED
ncbi:MAG: hypothetical protein MEQ07_06835 [Aquimonas sp.]|nr:hypothetical protein [Aquimonas sp.]